MQGKRVSDIETGLHADWWQNIFDQTYLVTDGDAVENNDLTAQEVDTLIAGTSATPGDRVIDLCCGQGRHLIELARRGYTNLAGRDGSAFLTNLARERASKAGVSIQFETGDVRQASPDTLGQARVVTLLGNSFGYLESSSADRDVLRAAHRLLSPEGLVYLDVTDGDWLRANYAPTSWEWVADDMLVCRERKLSGDRLVSREMLIVSNKGVVTDRTYAERLYSAHTIFEVLHEVGFARMWVEGSLGSGGTDPGMMGHRIVVVATKS